MPYKRLVAKLQSYGIHGNLLKWIENFLQNQTQRVLFNGQSSAPVNVVSGVPQGSVVGPILFILIVNSSIRLYADDAKLYKTITSREDVETLQADLRELHEWSSTWLLKFHPGKFKMMCLGRPALELPDYVMTDGMETVTLA